MAERAGRDEDRPYFFLSYAHTPVYGAAGEPDPDIWVDKFFNDLRRLIVHFGDLPSTPEIGFMDRQMRPGEPWPDVLSDALARCRVFVPLYSPRYFRSVNCGQEWYAFERRPVYLRKADANLTSGVVPVLWIPQDVDSLPEVASRLQYKHPGLGRGYADEGLFALLKFGYLHEAYEMALYGIAKRIVEVAKQAMIPIDTEQQDYPSLPSAFETQDKGRELRISVLAADRSVPLPGRSDGSCYGDRPVDWQPYRPGPDEGRTLAEHAARVARQLDFQPSIHAFEDTAEELLAAVEPKAPELLLFDRWALLNPEKQRLAREFDRVNPPWVSVMEPWCENDPDRATGEVELRGLQADTFRSSRRGLKPSFHSTTELPTLRSFSEELPRAAQRAMHAYEEHRRPRSPAKSGSSSRPSLRDARPDPSRGGQWRAVPPGMPGFGLPATGAADAGPTDYGATDFGPTDYGPTDYGPTDFGAVDPFAPDTPEHLPPSHSSAPDPPVRRPDPRIDHDDPRQQDHGPGGGMP
ncbi:TIR-like protein FxsC [Streptacidiphilus albus]|uniref:TIR-like protein FxsC n=1 Tax=Streptacidiphilus albus TaxID=105425 RepID=UPI00068F4827|nr:TIR-like protein FxsC [Streptacidiphilus albus]